MAYIYEVNGQRVEFEREPTEADIDEAARSLGSAPAKPEPSPAGNIAGAAGTSALGNFSPANPYGTTVGEAGQALKTGAQAVANKVGQTTLGGAGALAADAYAALHGLPPVATMGKKILQSVMPGSQTTIAEGLGAVGQGLRAGAGGLANAGKFIASGAIAPENLLTLPYQMAAYEQEKIRANPNAPGLENNPYAQTVRGEYKTQGQAGAANQRQALINNIPGYANMSPEEKQIMDQDRIRMLMQYKAAQKVLGQQ
jgi:hypothetical protein